MTTPKALFCPTCRKVVLASNEDFPFCSERCRRADLGKWASGDYKISSPIQDPDLLEELARSTKDNRQNDDDVS
ncbi:MAG: DNA gyrase inhibitor YacG [Acidobacteriota bacterium]|nr:DNA gyrase inhibitor YacG [Acidobacteriota bacterium]